MKQVLVCGKEGNKALLLTNSKRKNRKNSLKVQKSMGLGSFCEEIKICSQNLWIKSYRK